MRLYSIFDKKALAFSNPFVAKSDGDASRMIVMSARANQGKSSLSEFPEDYDLHFIGDFLEESGSVEQRSRPDGAGTTVFVAALVSLLAVKEAPNA